MSSSTAGFIGKGSYVMFGSEGGTWGNGNPQSHENLPFNPMMDLALTLPAYIQSQIHVFSDLDHIIEFDEKLDISKISLKLAFRDPILLWHYFTHKTVTSPWVGSQDNIYASFSDTSHDDTLWMQVHVHNPDGTNHLNLLFTKGDITRYSWVIESGQPMYEEVDLIFAKVEPATNVPNMDTGLDDGAFDQSNINGGFSLWDGDYDVDDCVLSKDCTITWGGTEITGLYIKRCVIESEFEKKHDWVQSSLEAQTRNLGKRTQFKATLEGKFKGNQNIAEFLAAYDSKTKQTFKAQYGTVKYMQFTLGYIKNIEGLGIPASGETKEGSYIIAGGAGSHLSYSWTGSESTDPRNYITH